MGTGEVRYEVFQMNELALADKVDHQCTGEITNGKEKKVE